MKSFVYKIQGTHCPACKKIIEKRIGTIPGVDSVEVNYKTGAVCVTAGWDVTSEDIDEVLSGTLYKIVNE
ncbi:MAG: Heavy metal-transporting P-type ATPase [Candidatus Woesebacteria bacterium GW2011_GWB1_43_14]|uniref:Heavy metal-transporting P-type ATPase n=1 Tax=Candidatus Woesebacteria bacterium GW2011_GWB1_43_14 TaxID=1618578 RepID=A0A0G1FPM5_9BACT|nr:MAG: HMA, heavy metal-associated-like protein [Candidatus Woesebacteria bacterium GW2011_GWC1_42_9]KKS96981.1 MAG: Heavy metal-transporting P-type ATPase [Candidatus Woesebacteria bacterium GW2011_GWB1_43_14]